MDSTNNFQHHEQHQQHLLQDHFAGCSPSINHPSSSPTSYGVSTSLHWNPTILSTTTSSDTFCNKLYENESSYEQESSTNLFPKTEEDMLSSFPSFTSLINSPNAHNIMENSCSFNGFSLNNINTRGLMNFPLHQQHQSTYRDGIPTPLNNWINSSHGFPSSNILQQLGLVSSPNHSTTSVSSCSPRLGLNMQAMDLLGVNTTFGGHVLHEEAFSPLGKNTPNNKALAPTNGIVGTKRAARSSSSDQSKASTSNNTVPNKKSLLKVSCPPLKVRKEKLGDRIAALHQLVSPFGKTDTASVLTEAIGYIQFLQDQIHTLCMPHPKPPSRNKLISKPFQIGVGSEDDGKDEDESQIDIRGRGLCLVPLSWTSYISPNQFDTSNTPFF